MKKKNFRFANQGPEIEIPRRRELTRKFLEHGFSKNVMLSLESPRREEFTAYGQSVIEFVHRLFDLCATHPVRIFASIVSKNTPIPTTDLLRKDYAYLFERYFLLFGRHCPKRTWVNNL